MSGWSGLRRPAARSGASASGRTGGYLTVRGSRATRPPPEPKALARRRWLINMTKFVLPMGAMLLLSMIALWPEFEHATDKARMAMRPPDTAIEGMRMKEAHYNGVDERGRPFTVTAEKAVQHDENRVDLTTPVADMTLESGSWINIRSRDGVYLRKDQQLDLSGDVVLYRDDGTTMKTGSVAVQMKDGAAASAETTHVEGPFGTLDAAGFITVEKGAAIQFTGPVHVTLNGVTK
jgi:lipopolysaccharide export system protein LptC